MYVDWQIIKFWYNKAHIYGGDNMDNISYKNKELISELRNVVLDKINNENEMVNINNLYGIFIQADELEQNVKQDTEPVQQSFELQ